VLTLIEKARTLEGEDEAAEMKNLGDFTLQDMLVQMRKIKQIGSFGDVLKMIPGANKMLAPGASVDDKEIARIEAIISSMTEQERFEPRVLNAGRRKRIARGSGTTVQDVNRLIKNYEEMRKMMKRMGRRGPGRGRGGRLPVG